MGPSVRDTPLEKQVRMRLPPITRPQTPSQQVSQNKSRHRQFLNLPAVEQKDKNRTCVKRQATPKLPRHQPKPPQHLPKPPKTPQPSNKNRRLRKQKVNNLIFLLFLTYFFLENISFILFIYLYTLFDIIYIHYLFDSSLTGTRTHRRSTNKKENTD